MRTTRWVLAAIVCLGCTAQQDLGDHGSSDGRGGDGGEREEVAGVDASKAVSALSPGDVESLCAWFGAQTNNWAPQPCANGIDAIIGSGGQEACVSRSIGILEGCDAPVTMWIACAEAWRSVDWCSSEEINALYGVGACKSYYDVPGCLNRNFY